MPISAPFVASTSLIARSAKRVFLVAVFGLSLWLYPVSAATPPTPTPSAPSLFPMMPVSADPAREIRTMPVVREAGQFRQVGLINILAANDFNTGAIRAVEPAAELLQDGPPGERDARVLGVITVRVPDEHIDAVINQLRALPGVLSADKSFLVPVETNDPYWATQMTYGLIKADLPRAWYVSTGLPSVHVAVVDSGA